MTVSEHGLDNVDEGKSFACPPMPGNRDVSQHFRRYRRGDPTRFFEEVLACGVLKGTDSVQTFEQRPPRTRYIGGGFGTGNP